jgi:UTP:GlnB (protein PII) uridylyltransferase
MSEDDRRAYSQQRLQELDRRIEPVRELLADHRLCVYATGSYGRLEAWEKSDIDLFFLEDDADKTKRLPTTAFIQLAAHLIAVTARDGVPRVLRRRQVP